MRIKDSYINTISLFLISVILLGLLLTGLRLFWFSAAYSGFMAPIIDAVSISGQAHLFHYRLGIALVVVLGFIIVYYFLSGWDQLNKFQNKSNKILFFTEISLLLMTIVSGLALHQGWWPSATTQANLKLIHRLGITLLLPATLIYIGVHLRKRKLSRELDKNRWNNTLAMGLILAALIAGIIYGWAATLAGKPVTLVSRFSNRFINVDGQVSSNEWSGSAEVRIPVIGGNQSEVMVRSLHSKQKIYFLIRWQDSTMSHNRQLVKKNSGWVERVSKSPDLFGERKYFEDMLAISFRADSRGCASSCHLTSAARSIQNAGRHYTSGDTVDLWKWQAVSSNPAGQADDGFWTGYDDEKNGGRRPDNETINGSYKNLNSEWQQPYFFPRNPYNKSWIWVGTGLADPYLFEEDTFSVGSLMPSVLVDRLVGDRGDVKARGLWRRGVWTVELSRSLRTGSPHDVEFRDTLYMGVAPFDNAEKKHAYHLKPIRLVIE